MRPSEFGKLRVRCKSWCSALVALHGGGEAINFVPKVRVHRDKLLTNLVIPCGSYGGYENVCLQITVLGGFVLRRAMLSHIQCRSGPSVGQSGGARLKDSPFDTGTVPELGNDDC